MFLINTAMEKISIGTAALIVVLGMAVVFFGLILLMCVTKIAGAIISHAHGHRRRQDRQAPQSASLHLHPRSQGLTAVFSMLHNRKRAVCVLSVIYT